MSDRAPLREGDADRGPSDAVLVAEALRLEATGKSQRQIAAALGKPRHWVRYSLNEPTASAGAPVVEIDLQTRLEFHPLANLFPLIEGAEFDDLVADIHANGQREEIILLDGKVLDGRNRYRACLAAGVSPRIANFSSDVHGEPLAFVISKNLKRRHLNESQRAMVGAQLETYRHGDNQHSSGDANLHVRRDEAAKQMGVSVRSVASAAVVRDNGTPEIVRAVNHGKLTVSQAAIAARLPTDQQHRVAAEAESGRANAARTVIKREARQVRERDLADKIAAGNLELPQTKFGVVVADPQWGRTAYSEESGMGRHASNHYPTANGSEETQDDAIKALPVASLAADHCVLGLWCTDAHRGVDVMRAWGFTPKSYFVWVKDVISGQISPREMLHKGDILTVVGAAGMGHWNRDRCEIMLIGVRGKPVAPAPGTQGERVWFAARGEHAATRADSHSDKPDCSLEWFERHWPNTPKVELNARRPRAGWGAWGNEIERRNVG